MNDPESRTVFVGVDGRADAQLPDWYAERRDVTNPMSFAEAIRSLPRATDTSVAYRNPRLSECGFLCMTSLQLLVGRKAKSTKMRCLLGFEAGIYTFSEPYATDDAGLRNPSIVYQVLYARLSNHSI